MTTLKRAIIWAGEHGRVHTVRVFADDEESEDQKRITISTTLLPIVPLLFSVFFGHYFRKSPRSLPFKANLVYYPPFCQVCLDGTAIDRTGAGRRNVV
jgi:hypothetical protein